MATKKEKFDLYQHITDKIIDLLEQGACPWRKPWQGGKQDNFQLTFETPRNYVTNKTYSGLNILLLMSCNKPSRYWLTFKQIKNNGGTVKKGAKSEIVTYWNFFEAEKKDSHGRVIRDESGKPIMVKIPMLKYYRVFNLSDTENVKAIKGRTDNKTIEAIKEIEDEKSFIKIEAIEQRIKGHENLPEITFNDNSAYYTPTYDLVNMPKPYKFNTNHHYYGTLFHELTHSTMHESRLDRKEGRSNGFGSEKYSFEELVAELGACFLCAEHNILMPEMMDNSASYIKSWIAKLRDDKKLIVKASGKAQKAVNYIMQ
jgi:antirestriction protein ArdC